MIIIDCMLFSLDLICQPYWSEIYKVRQIVNRKQDGTGHLFFRRNFD